MKLTAALIFLSLAGCAGSPALQTSSRGPVLPQEQMEFWNGLRTLCGSAFEGTAIHVPQTDSAFVGQRLVMHVSDCGDSEIRIPFHVGEDRSRTWVVRRSPAGLELKHIHRYADGTESTNTNYGGIARAAGTAHRQEFPADAVSVTAVKGGQRSGGSSSIIRAPTSRMGYSASRPGCTTASSSISREPSRRRLRHGEWLL